MIAHCDPYVRRLIEDITSALTIAELVRFCDIENLHQRAPQGRGARCILGGIAE